MESSLFLFCVLPTGFPSCLCDSRRSQVLGVDEERGVEGRAVRWPLWTWLGATSGHGWGQPAGLGGAARQVSRWHGPLTLASIPGPHHPCPPSTPGLWGTMSSLWCPPVHQTSLSLTKDSWRALQRAAEGRRGRGAQRGKTVVGGHIPLASAAGRQGGGLRGQERAEGGSGPGAASPRAWAWS